MSRPIHTALQKTGSVVQEYHSGAAESYLTCLKIVACLRCDICMCMQVRKIWQSTYVTAWENKLEFNYPDFVCCCMVRHVPWLPLLCVGRPARWRPKSVSAGQRLRPRAHVLACPSRRCGWML